MAVAWEMIQMLHKNGIKVAAWLGPVSKSADDNRNRNARGVAAGKWMSLLPGPRRSLFDPVWKQTAGKFSGDRCT